MKSCICHEHRFHHWKDLEWKSSNVSFLRGSRFTAMEDYEYAEEVHMGMDSAMEARFENLKLIGKGSFGDVFKG